VVAGGLTIGTSAALADITPAGATITNRAIVTYEDAAGNTYEAQSNLAEVTVAQIYAATIGVDVDATAAPGQIVYLPYTLTNTGNGTDTYDITASNDISSPDTLDSSSIVVYHDVNGNGVADAGEPSVGAAGLIVDGINNNIANLVVAVQVPANATDGQTLGVTLTAQAREGGATGVLNSVTDATTAPVGGRDGADGTNESLITVTGDAVLVVTKSAVPGTAPNSLDYTVTVRNNGNGAASNVVIFDGIPVNTQLDPNSLGQTGILSGNQDTETTAAVLDEVALSIAEGFDVDLNANGIFTDEVETTIGLDLNGNGVTTDGAIDGVYAVVNSLPSQGVASITFTVTYDPATLGGGYNIVNQGYASGDTDNDGDIDVVVASQVRVDTINADYAVLLTDTGTAATGDADNTANDDQLIDEASAGSTIEFTGVLTNQGNTTDFYILSATNTNFPDGTVFTFYDAASGNSLGNSTQAIAPGASTNILIRASLPAGVSGSPAGGAAEFEAVITAISANDPNTNAASNDMTVSLGEILDSGSDIHIASGGQIGTDEDPLGTAPYSTGNEFAGSLGATINIPLFIDNESGGTDVFVLGAGSSWDGTTLGALPPGWTVQFFEADTNGAPVNGPITATGTLAANSVDNAYVAVVTIPNDASQALPDVEWDNDGDTILDVLSANDADGDYPIFFQILSQNTGSSDTVLSAIDIDSTRELTLVGPGFKQTEAGGTVIYDHTLSNQGTVAEDISIASSNSGTGWTSSVSVDTDGNGDADTSVNALPVAGGGTTDTIDVLSGGVVVTVTINDTDADGIADSITLEPGVSLPISVAVFAPATATNGQTDFTTVTVSNVDTDPSAPGATVNNQTTVVSGNVSLVKTVAVDALCDGEEDTTFDTVQATQVKPGECAIWQVVATNLGSVTTVNVVITDGAPLFTTFEADSLEYCLGSNCDPDPILLPAANGGVGEYDAATNAVKFYVGDNSSPQTGVGGELVSAQSATVRFRVKVD
jgi:uncharacterized repeat protein (TIGR01451 family)